MSYVLINGKRYYKDDRTGRVTLDNVSQAEADRRERRGQWTVRPAGSRPGQTSSWSGRTSGTYPGQTSSWSGRTSRPAANRPRSTGRAAAAPAGIPWKLLIACLAMILLASAFFYNRSHTSMEEQAIRNYMNGQAAASAAAEDAEPSQSGQDTATGAENAGSASSSYIRPDSADRYLEIYDIQDYTREELQMIINEIYARHGRVFQTQAYADYFSSKDWYHPVAGKTDEAIVSEFNEFEKANVNLLSGYL